ncbi:MAG: glutathione S-transferase family protein [Alphaproteobacteria bacterium]|nr:glutathione S-transferase family protein [Alphaproteobacteria bacterium]
MGLLIDGVWRDQWYDTGKSGGRFMRDQSAFRGSVTAGGSSGFRADTGRYHLYVSLACPWAHRTLIMRKLKGLEEVIPVSVVHWHMGANGWEFRDAPGATGDRLFGASYLHEIYTRAKPDYSGRVTVPVLWDKERATIVNNESSEILRMLNSEFGKWAKPAPDFYPAALRQEIDEINAVIYDAVNNGVYKAGFATTQAAYEDAFVPLFDTLDELERRLARQRYLVGSRLTEADWRLFTTLIRFDPVYYSHFKCNRRRISDYPSLWGYLRDLYQVPGVAETVNLLHIKNHYYGSHKTINPLGIVPLGPDIDYGAPHRRGDLP